MLRTLRRYLALVLSVLLLVTGAPVITFAEDDSETPQPTAEMAETAAPIAPPTVLTTSAPTAVPTAEPTDEPTPAPADEAPPAPTEEPTAETSTPIVPPSDEPMIVPTNESTAAPTDEPVATSADEPTAAPTTEAPSVSTIAPTVVPTDDPEASTDTTSEMSAEPSAELTPAPSPIPILSIALDATELTLYVNMTHALTAQVEPANSQIPPIMWTSSDDAVATVDESGVILALRPGVAVIAATAQDESGQTAECVVTVPVPVASLSVTGQARIQVGKVYPFRALDGASPVSQEVLIWSSSDESIAAVDSAGIVTGVAIGPCVITATVQDGSGLVFDFPIEVLRATVVIHTKSNKQFSRAVCKNNEAAEDIVSSKTRKARTANQSEFQLMRLVVKTNGTDPEVDQFNPDTIIANKDNRYLIQFTTVSETEAAYDVLSKADYVKYVEPDCLTSLSESSSHSYNSWGAEAMNADEASTYVASTTSGSLKVAVVDSGVSPHSFIGSRLINGYDYVDNDSNPADSNGHGTHVAGTIVDLTQGLNVSVVAYRTFDSAGYGYTSNITNAIMVAADDGCRVINLSARGIYTSAGYNMYVNAINYATSKGATFCCAAGNDSSSTSSYVPACVTIPGCIVVASVNSSLSHSSYSNTGTSVDVCAPGENIVSCCYTGGYCTLSGTSMATPHISAACAIIKLAHPGYGPSQVENTLKNLCIDLGSAGFDASYGYGFPDLSFIAIPTDVTVTAPQTTLAPGGGMQLTATVSPAHANADITWTSSNESVLTVSASGYVTAFARGTARITVQTVNGLTDSIDLTVAFVPATGVTVTSPQTTLAAGYSMTLTANVSPSTADQSVTWHSSDEEVLTVSESGLVTGIIPGTARVTATTDNNVTGYVDLVIDFAIPTGVVIRSAPSTVILGSFVEPIAVVSPLGADQTITWTSSNSGVLALEAGRYFHAMSIGTARITATTVNGLTASVDIAVTGATPTEISVSAPKTGMKIGERIQLTAVLAPLNAQPGVRWASSDTDILSVSETGNVTGVAPGTARVTVTTVNGLNATLDLTVGPQISQTWIKIGKRQKYQLSVINNVGQVTWTSAKSSIAKVSSTGHVKGKKVGKTEIRANVDGVTLTCIVKVSKPVLSEKAVTVSALKKHRLTVSYTTKAVRWSSSRPWVATVNSSGKITARHPGKTTITAHVDGYRLRCVVTVKTNGRSYHVDMKPRNYDEGSTIVIKKAYYRGSTIYVDIYLVNNFDRKTIYKINKLKMWVYDEETETLLAKKTFRNIYTRLKPGKMKKITLKFTGSGTKHRSYELRLRTQAFSLSGSLTLK